MKIVSLLTTLIFEVLLCLIPRTASCARPETLDFAFAALCDSRGDRNGVNDEVLSALVTHLAQNHPDVRFVLFPGDMVTGAAYDPEALTRQLDHWREVMAPVYESPNLLLPGVFVAIGNHELLHATDEAAFEAFFSDVYGSETVRRGPGLDYSFDWGGSHFVSVSTDHWNSGDPEDPRDDRKDYHYVRNLDWLEEDLGEARARGAEHIFVEGHEPAFPIGGHPHDCLPDVGWYLRDTTDVSRLFYLAQRDSFWNILDRYDVDAYVCGHEHNYGRESVQGIYQVVAGGAGAPLYELNARYGDTPKRKRPGQQWTYDESVPFYEMLGYPHGPGDNCQASEDFVGGRFFQYTVFRVAGPRVFVEAWGIEPAEGTRTVASPDASIELKDGFVIER